jgi:hypothetical protein
MVLNEFHIQENFSRCKLSRHFGNTWAYTDILYSCYLEVSDVQLRCFLKNSFAGDKIFHIIFMIVQEYVILNVM